MILLELEHYYSLDQRTQSSDDSLKYFMYINYWSMYSQVSKDISPLSLTLPSVLLNCLWYFQTNAKINPSGAGNTSNIVKHTDKVSREGVTKPVDIVVSKNYLIPLLSYHFFSMSN